MSEPTRMDDLIEKMGQLVEKALPGDVRFVLVLADDVHCSTYSDLSDEDQVELLSTVAGDAATNAVLEPVQKRGIA